MRLHLKLSEQEIKWALLEWAERHHGVTPAGATVSLGISINLQEYCSATICHELREKPDRGSYLEPNPTQCGGKARE